AGRWVGLFRQWKPFETVSAFQICLGDRLAKAQARIRSDSVTWGKLALGCCRFACLRLLFFGGVEVQDLASLSRSRVDRAQVFAAFHLPNRGDDAVFLDGLISYFVGFGRGSVLARGDCGLAFRHK